jgi:hypothetical protein
MGMTLGPHPDPPADLATHPLPSTTYRCGWFRIHRLGYGPVFFGRSGDNRFDAPAAEFGVLYVGKDEHAAFIETFGHATGVRFVERAELAVRGLARIETKRPLRLVNLVGEGLARLSADARLTEGESYDAAHRYALALHEHPKKPDGIVYRARHDPSRFCAALFDRVSTTLEVTPLGTLADAANLKLVAALLDTYGFGLI